MPEIKILQGDCRQVLAKIESDSIDSIVTDPPYELGFMNKKWDASGIAYDVTVWSECLRVLKPGGHLLSFGGTRTYHRMACAIEDAGFEIRDCIMWVYSSGFPKSLDISKKIDRDAGAEREVVGVSFVRNGINGENNEKFMQAPRETSYITAPATEEAKKWSGWGSALKPSHEPIVVARKPFKGTLVENVIQYGTGGLNVDGCRIGVESTQRPNGKTAIWSKDGEMSQDIGGSAAGRWPANFIHDGSDEVVALFPSSTTVGSAIRNNKSKPYGSERTWSVSNTPPQQGVGYTDSGSYARFFYCAKASSSERGESNNHPTVKPISLMKYLCKLVTPSGGIVLDPFAGSGTTLLAARNEGFAAVGVELDPEHCKIIKKRLDLKQEEDKSDDLPPSQNKQLSLW